MNGQIFFGAGKNAEKNLGNWLKQGYKPLCFVDSDKAKQYTAFMPGIYGDAYMILPLKEATEKYPNADVYVTLKSSSCKNATEFLAAHGIGRRRIKFFSGVEYRLGCDWLGRMYLNDDKVRTCCVPGYTDIGAELTDDPAENYRRYRKLYMEKILTGFKADDAGPCKGCPNLRYDVFPVQPSLYEINISSKTGEDYCNAKCAYCPTFPKPSEKILEKRKKDVVGMLRFFAEHFPKQNFQVAVSGGDISVAPFRKELFQILKETGWTACIMTNAAIYCEEISELLARGKGNVLVTLDSTDPEVYVRCKGIHTLPQVLENLRLYAEAGDTWIKWIALEGVYKSFDEIRGVADFAKEIGAGLCISCDTFNIEQRLSKEMLEMTCRMIEHARSIGANLVVKYDHFHKEDAKYLRSKFDAQKW